jgi:uncharacterized protein (TIGR02996 family)
VTTEEDFQNQLDLVPDDWQTRLVFADWLQDHDDPRADGYRALAVNRYRPGDIVVPYFYWTTRAQNVKFVESKWCILPRDWFDALVTGDTTSSGPRWRDYPTRRAAEDDAANAFATLPGSVREMYLAAPVCDGDPR